MKITFILGAMGGWFRVYNCYKDIHYGDMDGICGYYLAPIDLIQLLSW
jgi:hypothetical protein